MSEIAEDQGEAAANSDRPSGVADKIGKLILLIRWLQLPMLLGLGIGLVIFIVSFFASLASVFDDGEFSRTKTILLVLDLVDMVLIANLMVMVLVSGYKIFIARVSFDTDPYVPAWLSGLNLAGVKTRISATVLLISTIHLLHELLDTSIESVESALLMLAAQVVFILTTLTFAFIERWEHH